MFPLTLAGGLNFIAHIFGRSIFKIDSVHSHGALYVAS